MNEKKSPIVICIIQARMGSSRLPGKVLKEICGHPMLWWVATRAQKARRVDRVVVATTTDTDDDAIELFCLSNGFVCFRGNEFDVLDRYYQAAKKNHADVVVRLTADCPLIDPELIDEVIETLITMKLDFAANRLPPPYQRTFPIGLDVEAASFLALENAWKNARKQFEREHVMPFLYDPENQFQIKILNADQDYGQYRWTVDTKEDLQFIRSVLTYLDCHFDFSWKDILKVIEGVPELKDINADVKHKTYDDIDLRAGENKDSE